MSHNEKKFVYGHELLNGFFFSCAYNIPYEICIILHMKCCISKINFNFKRNIFLLIFSKFLRFSKLHYKFVETLENLYITL